MDKPTTHPTARLRFLVFGAGAIGSYIGGSLGLQDQQVVFLEKPEMIERLVGHGLRLYIDGSEKSIAHPLLAASLPEALELGPFDAALFALKSFDTQAALQDLRPYASQLPPVLCLQNGVENESAIAEVLGSQKVIAGSVTSAIGRRTTGEIVLERLRGVGIADSHPLSEALVEAFNQAGLNAHLFRSAPGMKWSKMLTNLLANASSAILDMTPAEIFAQAGLYKLEIAQLREALAVMDAQQIQVVDLPGTPVRLLTWAIRSLPLSISRPLLRRAIGGGRGGKMPSFHIDLHSGGGRSEVDYLNGAVVRFGERAGVLTPVNRLLNETLLGLTRGEIPLEQFSGRPKNLLALWKPA
jgi:2-dehydropantoate 2-reductase